MSESLKILISVYYSRINGLLVSCQFNMQTSINEAADWIGGPIFGILHNLWFSSLFFFKDKMQRSYCLTIGIFFSKKKMKINSLRSTCPSLLRLLLFIWLWSHAQVLYLKCVLFAYKIFYWSFLTESRIKCFTEFLSNNSQIKYESRITRD